MLSKFKNLILIQSRFKMNWAQVLSKNVKGKFIFKIKSYY